MKKKFSRADGSFDEVEGTPEEIAAYERAREQSPPAPKANESKGNRRVLTEIQRSLEKVVEEQRRQALAPCPCPYHPWPTFKDYWFRVDPPIDYSPKIIWQVQNPPSIVWTDTSFSLQDQ